MFSGTSSPIRQLCTLLMVISLSCSSSSSSVGLNPAEETSAKRSTKAKSATPSENDIAFDLPDLTATIDTPSGVFQIEAFKSVHNDRILLEKNIPRRQQLVWVSVGKPTFVETLSRYSPKHVKLFHMTRHGFYTKVNMLMPEHRKLLAATASAKYKIPIKESQIVNLVLSQFDCSFLLFDMSGSKYLVQAQVTDFRNFPLRLDSFAPPNSVERRLFLADIDAFQKGEDIQLTCTISSRGKQVLTNTLEISASQSERIGLKTKLFGDSRTGKWKESAYVTREQTNELARQMYATLNIIEDYQMPESQFSDAFVNELIRQVASETFNFVPIDKALKTLSSFGFDVSDDLRPDVIKKDLGQILKIDKKYQKSRIVLDNSQSSSSSSSSNVNRSAKRRRRGWLFGGRRTSSWASSNAQSSASSSRSLSDQLRELNTVNRNDIKWEIEGEKVIPKSLNVAQLTSADFDKTLYFSRVKIRRIEAPFNRKFSLYTSSTVRALTKPVLDGISARVDKLTARLGAAVKSCRVCFRELEKSPACQGNRNTCSGWSDSPAWTALFRDATNNYYGCQYQWKLECRSIS